MLLCLHNTYNAWVRVNALLDVVHNTLPRSTIKVRQNIGKENWRVLFYYLGTSRIRVQKHAWLRTNVMKTFCVALYLVAIALYMHICHLAIIMWNARIIIMQIIAMLSTKCFWDLDFQILMMKFVVRVRRVTVLFTYATKLDNSMFNLANPWGNITCYGWYSSVYQLQPCTLVHQKVDLEVGEE